MRYPISWTPVLPELRALTPPALRDVYFPLSDPKEVSK